MTQCRSISRRRSAGVVAGLCLLGGAPGAAAADGLEALHYSVSLYHFYQQDYFDALTELMVAQRREQLGSLAGEGELLRAGMSLSYGMDRLAEQLFTRLLSNPDHGVDSDRAWFYLARLAWQRGNPESAEMALARMSPDYDGPLAQEADYLRASVHLSRGEIALASAYSERLPEDSPWLPYHYYNLGAVQAASGDWQGAIAAFHQFDDLDLAHEELRALGDKAYTAAGFAQLGAGRFENARLDFTRVRLHSPLADRALLGHGWAAGQQGDFGAALGPWQVLGERGALNDSVRESLLAIPWAYEQLGLSGNALAGYEQASDRYTRELAELDNTIDRFREDDLATLLPLAPESAHEWLAPSTDAPEGPVNPFLGQLLSRHGFQMALRELRDLQQLERRLELAGERLLVLDEVDAAQLRTWSAIIEGGRRDGLAEQQRALAEETARLRGRLERAQASGDDRALGDEVQGDRWQRLERAADLAARLGASDHQTRTLAIARGLLIWEDNEQFPARQWELQRRLSELESLAGESRQRLALVDQASARQRQSGFAARIEALRNRTRLQRGQVTLALAASEDRLRQVAIAELERQAEQLTRALGQSRLAIARLYDLGSPEVPR